MNWKDFLYFQKSAQVAILLLLVLIVLTLILNVVLRQRTTSDVAIMRNDSLVQDFQLFQESLRPLPTETPESIPYSQREQHNYSTQRTYTEKQTTTEKQSQNHTPFPRQEKLATGETIFLNSTDTAEWKRIPGIGSSFASRIVKYQNLLGGFASVEQLLEVYGVDNDMFVKISAYIEPDGNFRKIHINKLEFKELLAHPYLNYKQVQAIMNLRKRKGNIQSINELGMLDEFSAEDIKKLTPYLQF